MEFVYVRHPDINHEDGSPVLGGPVTRTAAETVWAGKGYEIVEPGAVVAAADVDADETVVLLDDLNKEQLRALASQRGVQYDGKTSEAKLRELLAEPTTDAPA